MRRERGKKKEQRKERSKERMRSEYTFFVGTHRHIHNKRMLLDDIRHVLSNRRHIAAAETGTLQVEKPAQWLHCTYYYNVLMPFPLSILLGMKVVFIYA